MHNEVSKTIQFERLQSWYCSLDGFMYYAVNMALGAMMYTPSLITFGSGIQEILRFIFQQIESVQCWYYRWENL
jgi:hypothetical protein